MSSYAFLYHQLHRTEPGLYGLPHPKISRIIGTMSILGSVVGDNGLHILNELMSMREHPKGELIGRAALRFPEIRKLSELSGRDGKINLEGLELFLAPLRFFANHGRIFEIEKELDELLALTDIGADTPIEFFRVPFPATYLHFDAHAGGLKLRVENVGTSDLLGAYIIELHVKEPAQIAEARPFLRWAGKDGSLTCYEITLVGYPQRTIADHGCSFLRLYVGEQMSGMTVAEVLDLNFEAYKVGKTYEQIAGLEEQLKAGTLHLAKVLLFINSESVRRQDRSEESDLVARIKGLGQKKQEKQKRRLERAYDRIIVTHQRTERKAGEPETRSHVRAHWRRGHFRHQPFGSGRAQSRLLWIQPMRIGELKKNNEPPKDYVVRPPYFGGNPGLHEKTVKGPPEAVGRRARGKQRKP